MNPIFIDTGLLIALEISDDQHHKVAIKYWKELLNRPPQLITTTYIFDEVVTFFNTRNYHLKAVELGNNLINSSFIQLIPVNEDLFNEGWLYFQKHQDKTYSLTDCLSFVIMQQLKINTALILIGILFKQDLKFCHQSINLFICLFKRQLLT